MISLMMRMIFLPSYVEIEDGDCDSVASNEIPFGDGFKIDVKGKCRECNSFIYGESVVVMSNLNVKFNFQTIDTREIRHDKKRFVSGIRRKKLGEALLYRKAQSVKDELIHKNHVFGDIVGPNIPNNSVIHTSRQESV